MPPEEFQRRLQEVKGTPMSNIVVLTGYRPQVDEYEHATVHAQEGGITRCGRDITKFKVYESSNHPVDCKRCLAAIAKEQGSI
jgi:hypothetical protein